MISISTRNYNGHFIFTGSRHFVMKAHRSSWHVLHKYMHRLHLQPNREQLILTLAKQVQFMLQLFIIRSASGHRLPVAKEIIVNSPKQYIAIMRHTTRQKCFLFGSFFSLNNTWAVDYRDCARSSIPSQLSSLSKCIERTAQWWTFCHWQQSGDRSGWF